MNFFPKLFVLSCAFLPAVGLARNCQTNASGAQICQGDRVGMLYSPYGRELRTTAVVIELLAGKRALMLVDSEPAVHAFGLEYLTYSVSLDKLSVLVACYKNVCRGMKGGCNDQGIITDVFSSGWAKTTYSEDSYDAESNTTTPMIESCFFKID